MTTPVTGTISTLTGSTATTTAGTATTTAQDKDMFLKLLVAQMKYQDPSSPTDSTQYLSQMAQFSMVEKLGDLTDSQTAATTSSQLQAAVGMIGKSVNYGTGDDATTGTVTGVTIVDSVPSLLIGTKTVALSDVTGVGAVPLGTTGSTGTGTPTGDVGA